MQTFIDLMQTIEKWTGIDENYSFIIAIIITGLILSAVVVLLGKLIKS